MHGRNVMMSQEKGLVVDISDFLKEEPCLAWEDLKKAYYYLYLPFLSKFSLKVPNYILDFIRKSYRLYRILRKLYANKKRVGVGKPNPNLIIN